MDEEIRIPTTLKRHRTLRVAYNMATNDRTKRVPTIRISGAYLQDLGFVVGGYFQLTINDDHSLTLRAITDDDAQ